MGGEDGRVCCGKTATLTKIDRSWMGSIGWVGVKVVDLANSTWKGKNEHGVGWTTVGNVDDHTPEWDLQRADFWTDGKDWEELKEGQDTGKGKEAFFNQVGVWRKPIASQQMAIAGVPITLQINKQTNKEYKILKWKMLSHSIDVDGSKETNSDEKIVDQKGVKVPTVAQVVGNAELA